MINVQSFTNIKVAPVKIVVRGAEAVVVERMEVKSDSSTSSSTGGLGGPHKYGMSDIVFVLSGNFVAPVFTFIFFVIRPY